MSGGQRVVVLVDEVKVVDTSVEPARAPFVLQMLAACFPGAELYLEGEPQDAASIEAMVVAALGAQPEQADATPQAAPVGVTALATADAVMRSLAQFQAEVFASIIAANEQHLSATLARGELFARQMFNQSEGLRLALAQLHVVDRGIVVADTNAKFRLLDAQAKGAQTSERRTRPPQDITFNDVIEGVANAGNPSN